MEINRKKRAIYAAFMLYWIFSYIFIAFLRYIPNPDRMRYSSLFSALGMICGGILLPLILPMRNLIENKRPDGYKYRLILTSFLFLPGIIIRLLGFQLWMTNPVLFAIMNFFTNMGTTVVFGLFLCLCDKNRVLWACLSVSLGMLIFYRISTIVTEFPSLPWNDLLFYASGLMLIAIGVLVLVFLFSVGKGNPGNEEESGLLMEIPAEEKKMVSFSYPKKTFTYCLFPLAAVFIISWTNTFTERLFIPSLRLSLYNFDLLTVLPFAALPFLGFWADRHWKDFLDFGLPGCAAVFVMTPSLLLLDTSDFLYIVLHPLLTLSVMFLYIVFPFIIMDLYKKDKRFMIPGEKVPGAHWYWFLAVSVQIIRTSVLIRAGIFRILNISTATAVFLLALAAIAFYILSRITISLLRSNAHLQEKSTQLLAYEDSFVSHNLTEREMQVASLLLQGLNNIDIKNRLLVSLSTVKMYVGEIFRKYGVKSRAEFISLFVRE